jgi:hypothetical protein
VTRKYGVNLHKILCLQRIFQLEVRKKTKKFIKPIKKPNKEKNKLKNPKKTWSHLISISKALKLIESN